jgi:hypothetical protein
MVRLPVSGVEVALRAPDGADDLLLQEATGGPVEVGLALVARLADAGDGDRDWGELTATDFEVLLLALRAARLGEHLALGFACPHCGARVEVGFRIADYLRDLRPRAVAGVARDPARPGWFRLDGAGFRLPSAGDQAAVAQQADPALALAARCLDEAARRRPLRARVERAMAAMAPEVSRPIAGWCPSCEAAVEAPLHVARIVVGELRRAAGAVHDEVDLIARAYHWPEAAILALPQDRRRAYAERIRRAQAQAA